MTVVNWRGSRFDARTRDMLAEAERISGITVNPTQGSYNTSVGASAGSHDGGGAADLSVRGLNHDERGRLVAALRQVGFAAWLRTKAQGFSMDHIHAVAAGCPDLAPLAARQVRDYEAGRNGLANGARDDGPRQWVGQTWETYQQTHEGDDMTPEESQRLANMDSLLYNSLLPMIESIRDRLERMDTVLYHDVRPTVHKVAEQVAGQD